MDEYWRLFWSVAWRYIPDAVVTFFESVNLLVGLVGLPIAIWQLWKTRKAADAAKLAVENSMTRLRGSSSLLMIQQLIAHEGDILQAVQTRNIGLLTKICTLWRADASELRGILEANQGCPESYLVDIQDSIACAGILNKQLASGEAQTFDFKSETDALIGAVDKVTAEFGDLRRKSVERSMDDV